MQGIHATQTCQETSKMPLPSGGQSTISMREPVGVTNKLFDLDDSWKKTPQVCTSALGNPLVTVVLEVNWLGCWTT